ncbi:MAG: dipeptidase [Fidelibacterota bacterium]
MDITSVIAFAKDQNQRFIKELEEFVKIPSISSSSEHTADIHRCADFLRDQMHRIGLKRTEVIATSGNPIVYGEWLEAEGKPTILIYGHYDVQPVDPLELWVSPPFEPQIRAGRLYGRGTVDDKGQIYIHLKAIESWLAVHDRLPLNIKFIAEGEEEVGSTNLGEFLAHNYQLLKTDITVISDTPMFKKGMPSICYGLRGLAYYQLNIRGSKQDLHSGSFGGVVKNPIQALAEIIAQFKDDNGRITIPGFYDDVIPIGPEERENLSKLPFDEEVFRREVGAPALSGEDGYSILENLWVRPTLDVCGIWGGFQEEGAKTIIPAEAHAKVSMRLVPNQTPEQIGKLFEKYIQEIAPPEVEVVVESLHGGDGFITDVTHPAFNAVKIALRKGFGKETVFIREGGSIPFVQTMSETLQVPCLLIGFGLPDENAHAPNEWLDLENYHLGILSSVYLYDELARN